MIGPGRQSACWITKATHTYLEFVILIAFPLQQWLRERTSMLRYSTLPVLFMSSKSGFRIHRTSTQFVPHRERSACPLEVAVCWVLQMEIIGAYCKKHIEHVNSLRGNSA